MSFPENSLGHAISTGLVNKGLWPNEADAVVERLVVAKDQEPMKSRWNDPQDAYPPQMLPVLGMRAEQEAIKYLQEHAPEHFALGILAPASNP